MFLLAAGVRAQSWEPLARLESKQELPEKGGYLERSLKISV